MYILAMADCCLRQNLSATSSNACVMLWECHRTLCNWLENVFSLFGDVHVTLIRMCDVLREIMVYMYELMASDYAYFPSNTIARNAA